jgi:hypothetical protein
LIVLRRIFLKMVVLRRIFDCSEEDKSMEDIISGGYFWDSNVLRRIFPEMMVLSKESLYRGEPMRQ